MNDNRPEERLRAPLSNFERPFRWRDLRDFAIGFEFWPFHWLEFRFDRDDDQFGGEATLTVGPLVLRLTYNAHDGPFGKPLPGLFDDRNPV